MLKKSELEIRQVFAKNQDRVRYEDVVLYTLETSHRPFPERAFDVAIVGKSMQGRANVFRKLLRAGKIQREKHHGVFFYSIAKGK